MAQWNFLDAAGLDYYHRQLVQTYIDPLDQNTIKYITYDSASSPTTMSFWKVDPSETGATAAYTITLPDFDATFQKLVSGSHQGEIVILDANGQVTYSGLALADTLRKSADTGATFTAGQALVFGTDTASGAATVKGIDLAAVATSGAAADVSYSNTIGSTAVTNVDDALDALVSATEGGVASKTVYITETAGGSGDAYSKRYGIYQGATGSSASPVVSEKLGDIDIPKDMVVESGSVVNIVFKSSDNTLHEGSESGPDVTEAIKGQGVTPTAADAGKYIKLTIANASSDTLYIKATDLVDIYTGGTTTDGTISIDNNNKITFTLSSTVTSSLALADNSVQKGWTTTAPTAGNLVKFDSNGAAVDTGVAAPTSGSTINTDSFAAITTTTIDEIIAGTYSAS